MSCDKIPSREELRYALVQKQGEEIVQKLEQATVVICGVGGLGSNVAINLARAGIKKLILVDFDCVDVTNLQRQQYKASQVGTPKTDALVDNIWNKRRFRPWKTALRRPRKRITRHPPP